MINKKRGGKKKRVKNENIYNKELSRSFCFLKWFEKKSVQMVFGGIWPSCYICLLLTFSKVVLSGWVLTFLSGLVGLGLM
jgi:hypothetical protein